jgi:hypothetical protein
MNFFAGVVLWFILLVLCWPVAVLLVFVYPVLWLLALPFRIIGFTLNSAFYLVKSLLMLPFKILRIGV